jgi:hypothetical protein
MFSRSPDTPMSSWLHATYDYSRKQHHDGERSTNECDCIGHTEHRRLCPMSPIDGATYAHRFATSRREQPRIKRDCFGIPSPDTVTSNRYRWFHASQLTEQHHDGTINASKRDCFGILNTPDAIIKPLSTASRPTLTGVQ